MIFFHSGELECCLFKQNVVLSICRDHICHDNVHAYDPGMHANAYYIYLKISEYRGVVG